MQTLPCPFPSTSPCNSSSSTYQGRVSRNLSCEHVGFRLRQGTRKQVASRRNLTSGSVVAHTWPVPVPIPLLHPHAAWCVERMSVGLTGPTAWGVMLHTWPHSSHLPLVRHRQWAYHEHFREIKLCVCMHVCLASLPWAGDFGVGVLSANKKKKYSQNLLNMTHTMTPGGEKK